jgi:cytochrome c5
VSIKRSIWLVVAGALAVSASLGTHAQTDREKAIAERLKPMGEVCIEGKGNCAAPAPAVAAGPRTGEQVYGAACIACHSSGVAGAPKMGVAADWAPRIAQGEDTLVTHAINGIRGMPPRGTCATCSDDEIRNAVKHMVAAAK